MDTTEHAGSTPAEPSSTLGGLAGRAPERATGRRRMRDLIGGGSDGNEQLTAMAGAILIVLLAVLGITILRIGQLISVHLFVGLLLLGPVAIKMASTAYRFVRYYTGNAAYRRKGPPEPTMRLLAPIVVLSTIVVFLSGVLLMFAGPSGRGQLLLIHKASFFVWVGFTGLHVLGHLPRMADLLRPTRAKSISTGTSPDRAGRWIALAGGLVGGLVLAIVLIPQFAPWTAHGVFVHHHH
jgi:hypothetical protein